MNRHKVTLVALAAAVALAGCGGSGDKKEPAKPEAGYPVTVGSVTLEKRPARIVSLGPTTTEMIYAIGAGPQVAAVDALSNFPDGVPKTELSAFKPNAEAVAAKNPDLVVLTNDIDNIVSQLTALKIPVYLAPAATTLDDSYKEITELGALTGHQAEAQALNQKMKDDIAKLVKDVPQRPARLSYYYELEPSLYTVTSRTFIGSLFGLLNMENVADPADPDGTRGGYPQLSAEALIKADPKMIFLADSKCCGQSAATVAARKGWSAVTAVKTGQIVPLDEDIASRWGPRVVDLLRAITDAVGKAPR